MSFSSSIFIYSFFLICSSIASHISHIIFICVTLFSPFFSNYLLNFITEQETFVRDANSRRLHSLGDSSFFLAFRRCFARSFLLTLFIQYLKKIAKMSFQNINGSIWKSSNTNLHNILHTNEKNAQKWKFNKHFHKKSCTTFYSYSQISHENYNKIHWKME